MVVTAGRRWRSLVPSLSLIHLSLHCNHALSSSSPALRLASWNLLAPMFATQSKYKNSAAECLPWAYREPRILERLLEWEPDVIFLQEVHLELFEDFVAKMEGYQGVLQKEKSRKRDLPVNAVLIRDGVGKVLRTESRSRAFIVVLQPTYGKDPIYLANVHLEAGYEKDETRFFQIRSLMKRLQHHVRFDLGDDESIEPAIIMAGDFNMRADDCIYDLLTVGHLPDDDEENHLIADTLPQPMLPLLPLSDAYKQCPPLQGPVAMTYKGGAVLDYIWLSDNLSVQETWQSHRSAAICSRRTWPSHSQPSDHLPIGAVISLR